ncbi:helix-turn-helix transcriptional regulator [Planococcus lenghuensis]|uniref:Transcriptional regulator n=1 Tax=Planococcus lenghuensis TaxID=2213202 RepID=A0A1Q2KZ62_9BACL|nr:metalloregulator ArsR/SmtB family transcription factor [Planococcus lenghuensis]AQQ53414.1 transcriptional regulator [Planococcus lenghuensis]
MHVTSRVTTKDKLLNLLKKDAPLTVGQLAERLDVTEMAIRKHLHMLEKDAFIRSSEIRQPIGRPIQTFSLSDKAEKLFPKTYENLTVDFLEDLRAIQGEAVIDQLFENRSRRLSAEYTDLMTDKSNEEKAETLKQIQNEKGYMVDLIKVNDHQFELIEHNCPIFGVSRNFKQACRCETDMFRSVLETDSIERTSCKADGDQHCRFMISFEKDSTAVINY